MRTPLDITRAKRRVMGELGSGQVQAWTKPRRVGPRTSCRLGHYSPVIGALRQASKGNIATALGLFTKGR